MSVISLDQFILYNIYNYKFEKSWYNLLYIQRAVSARLFYIFGKSAKFSKK